MKNYIEFREVQSNLSLDDIEAIVSIVGYRCRVKTINRLRSILTYGTSTIEDCGIMRRLAKVNGRWEYIPGQSYTDEIKTVRQVILGRI